MIETVTIIDEQITKTHLDIGIHSYIAQTLHLEIRTPLYQNTNHQRHHRWVSSSDSPGARVPRFVLPRKYTNAAHWVYVTTYRFRWPRAMARLCDDNRSRVTACTLIYTLLFIVHVMCAQ